jgi:hypothetical protein
MRGSMWPGNGGRPSLNMGPANKHSIYTTVSQWNTVKTSFIIKIPSLTFENSYKKTFYVLVILSTNYDSMSTFLRFDFSSV